MSGNGNGKGPLPFQAPPGVALVGQPITILTVGVPINMTLRCNCDATDERPLDERPVLTIVLSTPATCPSCGKGYTAFFNPQNGQTQMSILAPAAVEPGAELPTDAVPS